MLFTQSRFYWWNQRWDHRWELPGDGQTCDCSLYQWRGKGGGVNIPTLTGHIIHLCRVSDTRGRGRVARPFSSWSRGSEGVKEPRCRSTCNTTPCCRVKPPRHKSRQRSSGRCSSPVVIFEAVDLIFRVQGEGHSIKALVTDDTAETAWVVGLPQGL